MKLPYKNEPIASGKWYLSELPKIHRLMPGAKVEITYEGAHNTRLSSGFDSEEAAIEAERGFVEHNPEYNGQIYIWQPGA